MRFLFFALISFSISAQAQDRYILRNIDTNALEHDVRAAGGKAVRKMEMINALVAELPAQALNAILNRHPNVNILLDRKFSLVSQAAAKGRKAQSTQPPQSTPWGLSAIKSREANQITQGFGVKVCIIDTGISKSHPDLQANIIGGRNYVAQKGRINADAWDDDNGHGSHVAGTVAALDNDIGSVGVAPQASLYAVKVLNKSGWGYLSDITDGIHHCRTQGMHVINLSLGGSGDPTVENPLKKAVDQAAAAGIKVVVAAGNEGRDISTTIPAGYASVIAVAAVDSSMKFPSWSNHGLRASDYSAPGVGVYSTYKGSGYATSSGTSMAAPHVAGVIALAISANSAGLVATDLGQSVSRQGAGLIDALASIFNQ